MSVISIGRGRPRKPSAQKALEGTARRDRALENEVAAHPIKLPRPPAYLDKAEKKIWRQHAKAIDPRQIVSAGDVAAFEIMMSAYFRWRMANEAIRAPRHTPEAGPLVIEEDASTKDAPGRIRVKKRPEVAVLEKAEELYMKHATRFGLTPADRGRVSSLESEDERKDPLEEFADD